MEGKLRLPPLPKRQGQQETTWIMEDEDGFLASVPESKMDDWNRRNELSPSLAKRLADEMTQRLYGLMR